MDGLGIRTIVDLRTAEERQSAPTLWRVPSGEGPTTIASDKHSMRPGFGAPVTDATAARRLLSAFSPRAPDNYSPWYKEMFCAMGGEIGKGRGRGRQVAFGCISMGAR